MTAEPFTREWRRHHAKEGDEALKTAAALLGSDNAKAAFWIEVAKTHYRAAELKRESTTL